MKMLLQPISTARSRTSVVEDNAEDAELGDDGNVCWKGRRIHTIK